MLIRLLKCWFVEKTPLELPLGIFGSETTMDTGYLGRLYILTYTLMIDYPFFYCEFDFVTEYDLMISTFLYRFLS
jgi:hypothetical protein